MVVLEFLVVKQNFHFVQGRARTVTGSYKYQLKVLLPVTGTVLVRAQPRFHRTSYGTEALNSTKIAHRPICYRGFPTVEFYVEIKIF